MGGIAKFIVFALLLIVVSFYGYDLVEFQSRRADIRRLIDLATVEEHNPPADVVDLLHAASPDKRLSLSATRLLIFKLDIFEGKHAYCRICHEFLWWALVSLHLNKQEQIALVASLSYVGNGLHGLSAAAQHRYSRPLSALSTVEIATIVAFLHGASFYENNPDRLAKRRDLLLSIMEKNRNINLGH